MAMITGRRSLMALGNLPYAGYKRAKHYSTVLGRAVAPLGGWFVSLRLLPGGFVPWWLPWSTTLAFPNIPYLTNAMSASTVGFLHLVQVQNRDQPAAVDLSGGGRARLSSLRRRCGNLFARGGENPQSAPVSRRQQFLSI